MSLSPGMRLRCLRQSNGLLIRELALKAGVSKTTIQRTERGKNELELATAVKIAQVFEISPGILTIKNMPSDNGKLTDKIRTARLLLGLKHIELASLLGVDKSSIRDWELGTREISGRCYRLLEVLFNLIQSFSGAIFWLK